MKKDYFFPCGEKVTVSPDVGHAYGMLIAQKNANADENTRIYGSSICKKCKRDCYIEHHANYMNSKTRKQTIKSNFICIAYSSEYLENKDKPIISYLNNDCSSDYIIEIVLQIEDYCAIRYMHGKSSGVSLLDLVDESSLEEYFADSYDEKCNVYRIWAINNEGRNYDIEFESIDEIMNKIISVRLLQGENEQ